MRQQIQTNFLVLKKSWASCQGWSHLRAAAHLLPAALKKGGIDTEVACGQLDTSHKSPWVVISRCLPTSQKVDLTIGAHHKGPKDFIDCRAIEANLQHSLEFDAITQHRSDNWICRRNLSLWTAWLSILLLSLTIWQKIKFLFYFYVFYLSTPSFFIRVTNSRVNMKKKVAS